MPQVIDLRPDFGNDFAQIFAEKERLAMAKEAQKLQEQQFKLEQKKYEAAQQQQASALQGQTAGIMQVLLGTPEGQQLLGAAAQPYADAYNTFFGQGDATPEQLGLTPQGVAQGLSQSPDPYASAGFAQALQAGVQDARRRTEADRAFNESVRQFDEKLSFDERRAAAEDAWRTLKLDLDRQALQLQSDQNNFQNQMLLEQSFQQMQALRMQEFGTLYQILREANPDAPASAAIQQASLRTFGSVLPPSSQTRQNELNDYMALVGQGMDPATARISVMGRYDGPLRGLENLGLNPQMVDAIGRGVEEGISGYEMYRDVHEATQALVGGLSKEQRDQLKSAGISPEDWAAQQMTAFNLWFGEYYQDQDPDRLIRIYKNSLIDPDAVPDPKHISVKDVDFGKGPLNEFGKFMWNALTVWDAKSSQEDRQQAAENIASALPEVNLPEVRARLEATSDPKSSQIRRRAGGWPAPDTPSEFLVDALTRWNTEANRPDYAQTIKDFADFMWEALTVWDANGGRKIPGLTTDRFGGPSQALGGPRQAWERVAGGEVPLAPEGGSQAPQTTIPQSVLESIIMGPDSFFPPTGGGTVSPTAPVGWAQYADTLKNQGYSDEVIRAFIGLAFPSTVEQLGPPDQFYLPR